MPKLSAHHIQLYMKKYLNTAACLIYAASEYIFLTSYTHTHKHTHAQTHTHTHTRTDTHTHTHTHTQTYTHTPAGTRTALTVSVCGLIKLKHMSEGEWML